MDLATRCELLQAENDQLRERVAALQAELGRLPLRCPPEWRLTPTEAGILAALIARPLATKDFIMLQIYDGRDEAEPKIVDVFICKMRKKLAPHGIDILTQWGVGYHLSDAARALVRQATASEGAS